MTAISLKLLVDKERNRVVFTESDKHFVDILFSFLTLPMGTIIRLLYKQSSVGCMDKLYESVENLDNECPSFDCFTNTHRFYSSIIGTRCGCGKLLDKSFEWIRTVAVAKDGVFLKGLAKFIISDDLHIAPATISATVSLLQKLGIKDVETLEEQTVNMQREEVLYLLKMLLQSKMPLTDVFLREPNLTSRNKEDFKIVETVQIKLESENEADQAKITGGKLKLLQNKKTNKVLYAEAGEDIVDILFSFLTFPLGSIAKLLQQHSSIGCVDNLYKSVELLGVGDNCIKSEESKNILLAPKLFPHFNCDSQILRIESKFSKKGNVIQCETCWSQRLFKCKHTIDKVQTTEINPKLPRSVMENGGGFARRSVRFMVSNGIVISPPSSVSGINIIKELKVPICSLIEKEIIISEAEALNLLRTCLTSRTALDGMLRLKNCK